MAAHDLAEMEYDVECPTASAVHEYMGVCWAEYYPMPEGLAEVVQAVALKEGGCRTCARRTKYIRYAGPHGALMFHNERMKSSEYPLQQMRKYAEQVCGQDVAPELLLVTGDTFGSALHTGPGNRCMEPFYHWTVLPSAVTQASILARISPLWNLLCHSIDVRLSKFLTVDARQDMQIVNDVQPELQRPDHYKNAITWVLGIQDRFPKAFEEMTAVEKMQVRIFAMMTGKAEGAVHYDFATSSAFQGFMEAESREALKRMMDSQSDPRLHMRDALARAMDTHANAKASKFTVSLVWDGTEYKDDLDLHVVTDGKTRCYYGCPRADGCRLDFDAGISGKEAAPVENISVRAGTMRIQVDNYTRRTKGDVPFVVMIREYGEVVREVPGVWPKGRASHQYLDVCTHVFKEGGAPVPAMSDKAAAAARAQDKDFQELIGVPQSTVATMADLAEHGIPVMNCPKAKNPKAKKIAPTVDAAASAGAFEAMMNAVVGGAKKGRLHEACRKNPSTVQELVAALKNKPRDLAIHLPDHAPGYIVNVTTNSAEALKSGKKVTPFPCHYQDKFKPPVQPVEQGTARMDNSWAATRDDGKVRVCGIADMNGKPFFILEGARLPDVAAFPLGGGFYPQALGAKGHVHRGRWTFFHTQLKPTLRPTASPPAIGTFLTGVTATVYMDGLKLDLKVGPGALPVA
eukprot:TRINITY_DN654_c0_g1_i1.p1 TRINITY_DN654_c0_g1~~TRINITY_DN654_c0_g1_i1.p1  ORF type:complete len:688 (+),score=227.90 TRINITY_DN654_c0_g1_i1:52-2115(+)